MTDTDTATRTAYADVATGLRALAERLERLNGLPERANPDIPLSVSIGLGSTHDVEVAAVALGVETTCTGGTHTYAEATLGMVEVTFFHVSAAGMAEYRARAGRVRRHDARRGDLVTATATDRARAYDGPPTPGWALRPVRVRYDVRPNAATRYDRLAAKVRAARR